MAGAARLLRVPQNTLNYWLEGGQRRGKVYRPVIRVEPRGSRAPVTWDEDVATAWRPHDDPQSPVRIKPDTRFGRPAPVAAPSQPVGQRSMLSALAGTVVAVSRDDRSEIRMPATTAGHAELVVSRIGLGLAALGRPAYITSGRENDLPDRSVAGLRARTVSMLDAAYEAGVRYFDAARSYGRAEEFLGRWLADRGHYDAVVGSKWGYRYTGDWRLDADRQEVKEHSLAMFTAQLAQTRALLGDRLALYQVHSLTAESGLLDDPALLAALGRLRAEGVIIGLTTSGPGQADTLRRALQATADGQPLFGAAQVTWNLLEPSVGPAAAEAAAAGWTILIKEALANGRLAPGGDPAGLPAQLAALATARNVTADALALAAALANPWAGVVLSGAVTPRQLHANLAALAVGDLPHLDLAEPPGAYWASRAARPWH